MLRKPQPPMAVFKQSLKRLIQDFEQILLRRPARIRSHQPFDGECLFGKSGKLLALRAQIAETLWKLNSNVMRDPSSTLDQFLKRKLAVVCCAINGCAYCTAHSCSMLKKPRGNDFEGWGMDEAELQAIISGSYEPKNDLERACFDYVRAASADPLMVTGKGLGLFAPVLRANRLGRAAYAAMHESAAFNATVAWDQARLEDFDALLLPGGHAKGMRPYLESAVLQALVVGVDDPPHGQAKE